MVNYFVNMSVDFVLVLNQIDSIICEQPLDVVIDACVIMKSQIHISICLQTIAQNHILHLFALTE